MGIKNLELILENCDTISIPSKHIGFFQIANIKTSFSGLGADAIRKTDKAKLVVIELAKGANVPHKPFGQLKPEGTTFDRLQQNDITYLEFELYDEHDGTCYNVKPFSFYVDWNYAHNEYNTYQKTYVSGSGGLYIVIGKRDLVFDFFDKPVIDKESYWQYRI